MGPPLSKTSDTPGAGQPSRPDRSDQPGPVAAETALQPGARRALPWLAPAFRWHLRIFLAVNAVLNVANIATGRPWWAFWPLAATVFLLGVHYLIYKAMSVDEQWADERIEELNLKSYDRGHIEDLKSRYGDPPDRKA